MSNSPRKGKKRNDAHTAFDSLEYMFLYVSSFLVQQFQWTSPLNRSSVSNTMSILFLVVIQQ